MSADAQWPTSRVCPHCRCSPGTTRSRRGDRRSVRESAASMRARSDRRSSRQLGSYTITNSSPPILATTSAPRTSDMSRRAGLAQHDVAGIVTVKVVDRLEIVDVEECDRERHAASQRAGQANFEQFVEQPSVGQSGQRVAQRERRSGSAWRVRSSVTSRPTPCDAAGGCVVICNSPITIEPFAWRNRTSIASRHWYAESGAGDQHLTVVVEHVEERGVVLEEDRRRVPEDVLDRRAHVVEVGSRLSDEPPHDVGRLVGEIAEPGLALGQASTRRCGVQ